MTDIGAVREGVYQVRRNVIESGTGIRETNIAVTAAHRAAAKFMVHLAGLLEAGEEFSIAMGDAGNGLEKAAEALKQAELSKQEAGVVLSRSEEASRIVFHLDSMITQVDSAKKQAARIVHAFEEGTGSVAALRDVVQDAEGNVAAFDERGDNSLAVIAIKGGQIVTDADTILGRV